MRIQYSLTWMSYLETCSKNSKKIHKSFFSCVRTKLEGEAIKLQNFILRTILTGICIIERNPKIGERWDVAPLTQGVTDHPTQAPSDESTTLNQLRNRHINRRFSRWRQWLLSQMTVHLQTILYGRQKRCSLYMIM